jgi:hypothetical protein
MFSKAIGPVTAVTSVLAVAAITVVGLTGVTLPKGSSTASSTSVSATASSSPTPKPSKSANPYGKLDSATIAALSPTTVSYEGVTSGPLGLIVFDLNSKDRLADDAVCNPLTTNTDLDVVRQSLEDNIWTNPQCGVTWAHFLGHKVVDGVKVVDLPGNEWLKPYDVAASKIKSQAQYFVPLLNKTLTKVDKKKITSAQYEQAAQRNWDYQVLAGWLNTMINSYQLVNISAPTSTLSYHVMDKGQGSGLHPVGLDPAPDSKPALVMELIDKNACAPSTVIGANMTDSRPEQFPDETCVLPPVVVHLPPHGSTPPSVVCVDLHHFWSAQYGCLLNKPSGTVGWITAPGKTPDGVVTGSPSLPQVTNTPTPTPTPTATSSQAPAPTQTPAPVQTVCAPPPGQTTCITSSS